MADDTVVVFTSVLCNLNIVVIALARNLFRIKCQLHMQYLTAVFEVNIIHLFDSER